MKRYENSFKSDIQMGKNIIKLLTIILIGIIMYLGSGIIKQKRMLKAESIRASSEVKFNKLNEQFPTTNYVNVDKVTGVMEYGSPTMMITIDPIVKTKPNLRIWVSNIRVKEASQIKSAFAGEEFSLKNREKTSEMAAEHGAVFAVNGAAYGFNEKSFVIRDGILYRETSLDCAPLIIKNNGDFEIFNYGEKTGEEIIAMGGMHTYDFGPDLIKDGEIVDYGNGWYKEDKNPRTAIGQKGPLEYVVIVADGRNKESEGVTFYDLALEFQRLGCKWAYALDGGGSTTLYFNGNVINTPSDWNGEREVSDILYFGD
ncbi:MAG: phosphodiester glycosidase family protein [Clostridium sp.]|uniref:phosphodiester glycosidase family protein n=1 Tax=Clostridium sp. TaxID=1506 RepID=UPI0030209F60